MKRYKMFPLVVLAMGTLASAGALAQSVGWETPLSDEELTRLYNDLMHEDAVLTDAELEQLLLWLPPTAAGKRVDEDTGES